MAFSVLQDLLDEQYTLDEAISFLKTKHKLLISEKTISNKRVLHLTRPLHPNNLDTIQDEASIVLVNDNLKIISKSINRIYNTTDSCSSIDINNNNRPYDVPLIVEEWIPGIMVVVSKYRDTYLVSTERSITGDNTIDDSKSTCRKIVLSLLNEIIPVEGVKALFNRSTFNSSS